MKQLWGMQGVSVEEAAGGPSKDASPLCVQDWEEQDCVEWRKAGCSFQGFELCAIEPAGSLRSKIPHPFPHPGPGEELTLLIQ